MWDGSMEKYQDASGESSKKLLLLGKKATKKEQLFSFASRLLLLFLSIVFIHF